MDRIKLPFNLPCHLKVSSYLRGSGSHSRGDTIDITIFVDGETREEQCAQYVGTYAKLFGHLKYGALHINAEQSNWHYHLEALKGVYQSGAEHYIFSLTQGFVQVAPTEKINMSKYGAFYKYSKMLNDFKEKLAGVNFWTSFVSPKYWKEFWHAITLKEKDVTYIYYDENAKNDSRISKNDLLRILDCFSSDYVQDAATMMLPGSPESQSELKELLIASIAASGFLYVLNQLPSDKSDK